ncbi:DsbA family protein [Arcobacter sp. F155]|uniref:DsbA family protein n=1 Tax=Arcobacter sp. F155 TaxID=2044512 RepID=UPI00215A0BA3|nr:DsbA family protein [Arcobacter sp. F155]
MMKLIYVMDPMCAWCYAFTKELEEFLQKHPSFELEYIMGGLAPDNDTPMDENMKKTISSYWVDIEKKTKVTFNHDYWKENTPYRSTYPACRAVITAETLQAKSSAKMVKSIQSAYYKEAKNPSLKETLVKCANSIGLDETKFIQTFDSKKIEETFQEHLRTSYKLQVRGFPALFYINEKNEAYPLTFGFTTASNLESQFKRY